MQKHNSVPSTANNEMIMFIVINTASLQLIPTFLCTLRQNHGAANPLDIIVCLWITSLVALIAGVFSAKLFEKAGSKRDE
jgi:spore maturation protein A